MYKVFIYDKPVLIHKKPQKEGSYEQFSNAEDVKRIILTAEKEGVQGIEVVTNNPMREWESLQSFFKNIIAAGGVVSNSLGEILVIFRNGKWDLPKGKLERGEDIENCAVREVEEECGVSGLEIINELPSTYHCYQTKKGKWVLKRTYWYRMVTKFNGNLVPQTEEGIERVEWFLPERYGEIRSNSYNSIKLVFDELS